MRKTTRCEGPIRSDLGADAQRRVLALERAHRELRLMGAMLDYWELEARTAPDATARAEEAEKLADLLGNLVAVFATAVPVRRMPPGRRTGQAGTGKAFPPATAAPVPNTPSCA